MNKLKAKIKAQKAESKRIICKMYLQDEIQRKLHHLKESLNIYISHYNTSTVIQHNIRENEPRIFKELADEQFEQIDEILNLENLSESHDSQFAEYNIRGKYGMLNVTYRVNYSSSSKCERIAKTETYESYTYKCK